VQQLLPVLVLALIVITFGALLLAIFALLGPKVRASAAKLMPYECGVPGQEAQDTKISVKYYLTAILFILFDIEIIFMYPWAVTFNEFASQGYGIYIFSVMFIFLLIFIFGLFWEIKSKALEWE
jgi:NADH-quinone oxidoreductase subunit A